MNNLTLDIERQLLINWIGELADRLLTEQETQAQQISDLLQSCHDLEQVYKEMYEATK